MPAGLLELERLGARGLLTSDDCSPIRGIRYVQEDGGSVAGRLAAPGGLGIRRVALANALHEAARRAGVEVREGCRVEGVHAASGGMQLQTNDGTIHARLIVAADGLHSPLRKAAGLDASSSRLPRRFGLRRHLRLAPWTELVEVHFAEGVEAYVTPVGPRRVGVAFLWEQGRAGPQVDFETLLTRFPRLRERLAAAEFDSEARGAGPLWQVARTPVADRLVLLGDAAGYIDALTGEGLTLAFRAAAALGEVLPEVLAPRTSQAALSRYARHVRRDFRRYALFTRLLLAIARRPSLRRAVVGGLQHWPPLFERLVRLGIR